MHKKSKILHTKKLIYIQMYLDVGIFNVYNMYIHSERITVALCTWTGKNIFLFWHNLSFRILSSYIKSSLPGFMYTRLIQNKAS